ncbi:MAG: sugar phosphate isomerase/epimerase [Oscillospiraceae bacterium]|nr:sugar phosphate isomerase/epimerase [Oscillospiraceae bacterium]
MEFGISTSCFYPAELEKAVGQIADWKISAAEVFVNTVSELERDFIKRIRRRFDEGGVKVTSLHPFTSGLEPLLFFSEYDRRFLDSVELYKRYFEAAAELGAKYFVLHGERKESVFDKRKGYERIALLDKAAKEFGIRVAQENVSRCRSAKPDYIREMREYLGGDVKFVLDLKQCIRSEVSVYDMLDAMGECVAHVHVSDSDEEHDCLPIGCGNFDFAKLFGKLQAQNYDGALVMELYRHNYGETEELRVAVEKLSKML